MTTLNWKCIHYSIPETDVNCETVVCLDKIHSDNQLNIKEYNKNAALEIHKRKSPGDLILCFYGDENKEAAEFNSDLKIIEPSIGYSPHAVFAPYRVFASYAQMHYFYGLRGMLLESNWQDCVIYNAITADEFEYLENKDNYILYFGRVIEEKGIHIAIQATEAAGKNLIIAGPGDLKNLGYTSIPNHVTLVGVSDPQQRKKLMSNAQAIIGPTYYLEPFGNMIAEGYMSGTPAITSDWGAFTENVVQGVTGFRCREFKDFVNAIHHIDQIKSQDCRDWAMKHCEDSVVHNRYDQYFKKVQANNFYR